jgi:hypothetical protein
MTEKRWAKARFTVTDNTNQSRHVIVQGRYRWALESLQMAGANGCTPIDRPAPRWSAYVHVLRHEYGIDIETITEPHDGPFAGHHARYVLRCTVTPWVQA